MSEGEPAARQRIGFMPWPGGWLLPAALAVALAAAPAAEAPPVGGGDEPAAPRPSGDPATGARPQAVPSPQSAPAPQTAPGATPTHEATDFRLTLSRGGQDLFTLRARRSATFGASYTDLQDVTLTGSAGPIPGLRVKASRGRYQASSGDFSLEGAVAAGRPGEIEAHVEHLSYSADEGVARSDDPVVLSGKRLRGSARGLEVAPARQRLTLLADAVLYFTQAGEPAPQAELRCGRLHYLLSPPRVECEEGVHVSAGERELEASFMHMDLREADRRPAAGHVEGRVHLEFPLGPASGAPSAPGFHGFPSGTALALGGGRIDLEFDPESGGLRSLTAPAGGTIEARPLDGSNDARALEAAWFHLGLRPGPRPGGSAPERLEARGHVRVSWRDATGAGELRSGALAARWSAEAGTLESGHLGEGWRLERPDLRGAGSEADLDLHTIELRGGEDGYATLERAGRLLAGARLRLPRGQGLWTGDGGVQARRSAEPGGSAWGPLGGSGEFWVTARRFEVDPQAWRWLFEESVRAWQESNLIETDRLEVDETGRTLSARGSVVTRGVTGTRPGGTGADLVWVRAPQLDYAEDSRRPSTAAGSS